MRGLMRQSKVVVFIKGTPDAPRCGFSRQTVALLREQKVQFTHFDILSDESVRQGESPWTSCRKCLSCAKGLKVLNNWPTFPQIIVDEEFVGGLDVLKESIQSGEFREMVTA